MCNYVLTPKPAPEHPEPSTAAANAKGEIVGNRKLPVLLALAAALLIAPLLAINNPATAQPATLKQRADEITYHTVTEIKQARTRGKVQLANADTASTRLQASGVASGSWYKQCSLPSGFNPIHASQQPDGTLLFPIGSANSTGNFDAGTFVMYRFNPSTCSSTRLATPVDMFCNAHIKNAAGNTYVLGGTARYDPFHGLATLYEYDWKTRTFTKRPSMSDGRWYPGAWYRYSNTYASWGIFTLSGLGSDGNLNTGAEFYSEREQRWYRLPYDYAVETYPQGVPTTGNNLFLSGETYSGDTPTPGILNPETGSFRPVPGLPAGERSMGATFFAPGSSGRSVIAAGGGSASTAKVNLYVSSPAYTTGPSLAVATRYLSNTALWDGRRLLAGGEDTRGNPLYYSYVYGFSSMVRTANTAYSHQYHSTLWTQPSGRPCLAGGNPKRDVVQPAVECFRPWFEAYTRPAITSAPSTITRGQAFSLGVSWVSGTSRKEIHFFPLTDTTHQFEAQNGDYKATLTTTGGVVNTPSTLMPPGYYFIVAIDSRGVPSKAVIRQLVG